MVPNILTGGNVNKMMAAAPQQPQQPQQLPPEVQEFLMRLTDDERDQLLTLQLDARALECARDRKMLEHQEAMIGFQRKYRNRSEG